MCALVRLHVCTFVRVCVLCLFVCVRVYVAVWLACACVRACLSACVLPSAFKCHFDNAFV